MHSRCASLRERTATFSPFISSKPIILKATAFPTLVITAMSFAISPVLEYSVSDCGIIPRIGPSSKNSSFPFSPSLQKEAIPSRIFPLAFARSSDDTDTIYSRFSDVAISLPSGLYILFIGIPPFFSFDKSYSFRGVFITVYMIFYLILRQ